MSTSKFLIIFALSAVSLQPTQGITLSGVLDIINVAKDVVVSLAKAWDIVDQNIDFNEVPIPILHRTENKLFSKIDRIHNELEDLATRVDEIGTQSMTTILHSLPERVRLELRLNDLLDYRTRIDASYRRMTKYALHQHAYEQLTLEDFARTVISHDPNSIVLLLERMHSFIVPNGNGISHTGLFKLLDSSLENFDHDFTYGLESLNSVWALQLAYADLRGIYALYESFRRFQRQQTAPGRIPSPKQAWIDLAESVLYDSSNSVEDALSRVQETMEQNLFQASAQEVEGDMMCEAKQSPQQVLYNLYDAIALTELKGYTMVQFSYMLLRLYGRGNFTKESENSRERFQERINSAVLTVKNVMQNVRRDLWNCDPKKHIRGETYEEITNLLQGYVQNEVDLNPEGTCRENCAEYTYTKNHGCYENLYCRQQRNCNGKIVNCQFFDSDMWICNANPKSGRRYEYIKYENGRVLGRDQGCARGTTKVDSWWRWLFWHCSYCFCLCDEQGPMSDRYINMRSVLSDIDNNKVVTGLRFVKKNRIIHLQIQEGELLPRLNINASSLSWKPVDDYKITDRKVFNGQDYHTLSWEKRILDLDDLEADDGYVMTGVRFKEIGTHLNFEIYTTKFDFDTGKLKPEHSTWKDNPNTDVSPKKPRTRVYLKQPDIPTRTTAPSVPTSKTDQYIEFTHSDIMKDAAQTTVPFFDAQKLESLQAVPLTGAGIFHKGRNSFGGFITPRIITFDVSKYLKAAFLEGDEKPNVDLR